MTAIKSPKKLIEVALPLDDINAGCQSEKNPFLKGHPRGIHLWWARRPLAAARAILFSQLVNDPSEIVAGDKRRRETKERIEREREELFDIIRELVKWENINNEEVLNLARQKIWESWRETCHLNRNHPQAAELFNPEKLPAFHDPFAGGGAIPLEAQRLGLESYATDLNPVAVMINKAMIEIPPKFAGQPPVGPIQEGDKQPDLHEDWSGARGLAEDVSRYGAWLREELEARIGHLYPKIKITPSRARVRPDLEKYLSSDLKVVAWLWARTVKSPNPAYSDVDVPLLSSFVLCSKKGKEAYLEPVVDGSEYKLDVKVGPLPKSAKLGTKASGRGADFYCIVSGSPIDGDYIKSEGVKGRLGLKLIGIVADGKREKVYLDASDEDELLALSEASKWQPKGKVPKKLTGGTCVPYGMSEWHDLFHPRQVLALTTVSDIVSELKDKVVGDALAAGRSQDARSLSNGGLGAFAYAEAISTYIAMATSQYARYCCSLCGWNKTNQNIVQAFGRQAIPMVWDFAEGNPIEGSLSIEAPVKWVSAGLLNNNAASSGFAFQSDACAQSCSKDKVVSTDPPYYDNISYADLSDFFYVWLRKTCADIFPDVFSTLASPKSEELIAAKYRHKSASEADKFFMDGMGLALRRIFLDAHPAFPVTIYYAFKQSETKGDKTISAGWVTFLEAVIGSGFLIDGTWPVKTEKIDALKVGVNALASSIVLVCKKKMTNLEVVSRRDFQRQLREEMPEALETMIGGESGQAPIAPVDLAQAAIGPGMAIYSKYEAVLNQDGTKMSVHDALVLINRAITEFLTPDSGNFDADTQFCASWFDQYAWSAGPFGEADTLARAKGTSVDGIKGAGVVESGGGKVRLLKWSEYESEWDPTTDKRTPVWEACHQMIRRLQNHGESAAGELLAKMPEKGEAIRQLSYHLYTLCERKKWAEEARAYNELIGSWHAIVAASHETGHTGEQVGLEL